MEDKMKFKELCKGKNKTKKVIEKKLNVKIGIVLCKQKTKKKTNRRIN